MKEVSWHLKMSRGHHSLWIADENFMDKQQIRLMYSPCRNDGFTAPKWIIVSGVTNVSVNGLYSTRPRLDDVVYWKNFWKVLAGSEKNYLPPGCGVTPFPFWRWIHDRRLASVQKRLKGPMAVSTYLQIEATSVLLNSSDEGEDNSNNEMCQTASSLHVRNA